MSNGMPESESTSFRPNQLHNVRISLYEAEKRSPDMSALTGNEHEPMLEPSNRSC